MQYKHLEFEFLIAFRITRSLHVEDEQIQRQCAQFRLGYSIWNGLFEQYYEAPLLVTRELRHESADRRTVCPPRVGGGRTGGGVST